MMKKVYEKTGEIRTKEIFTDEGHLDALDGNFLFSGRRLLKRTLKACG